MLVATTVEDFLLRDGAKAERRRQKDIERADEGRVLDPWERFRALSDYCDTLLDLTELYDRKTRFALLIFGGLNAINVLVAARSDLMNQLQRGSGLMGGYVACYVLLSLCLLIYAISALRPREHESKDTFFANTSGLRLSSRALGCTLDDYCESWRTAQIGQMNHELSVIAYRRLHTNASKLKALHRVYLGLYLLVFVTGTLFLILGLSRVGGA